MPSGPSSDFDTVDIRQRSAAEGDWPMAEKLLAIKLHKIDNLSYSAISKELEGRSFSAVCGIFKRMKDSGEYARLAALIVPDQPAGADRPPFDPSKYWRRIEWAPLPKPGFCKWPLGDLQKGTLHYCQERQADDKSPYCHLHMSKKAKKNEIKKPEIQDQP